MAEPYGKPIVLDVATSEQMQSGQVESPHARRIVQQQLATNVQPDPDRIEALRKRCVSMRGEPKSLAGVFEDLPLLDDVRRLNSHRGEIVDVHTLNGPARHQSGRHTFIDQQLLLPSTLSCGRRSRRLAEVQSP